MYPRNLAELKRFIRPGIVLERTHSKYAPEPHRVTVTRAQGSAFAVTHDDGGDVRWHYYEKAGAYSFTDDGFAVTIDGVGVATYRYLDDTTTRAN